MSKSFRSGLYTIAALFLMYNAYELYRDRNVEETTMSPAVRTISIIFFAAAGLALLVYSIIYGMNRRKAEHMSETDAKG